MVWNIGAGLEGKGVMVTGATGGIGKEVVKAFAATGARVMAVDIDQGKLDALTGELEGEGHFGRAANLVDLSCHHQLVNEARTRLGSFYVVAHFAAVWRRPNNINDVTEEDWDYQLDTNLKATFFLCRTAAQTMIEDGQGGRIVTFTSQAWWTGGFGGSVVYSASKGGIVSLTRGLARTYGPQRITVNSVAPAQVHTPMLMTGLAPEIYESMRRQTPLGYVAQPEEIASTVVFLASRHAGYITGATINVSGGFLMY